MADSSAPQTSVPFARYPYLETLNQAQREAVEATEGPVLVLAGAGTGKTRVLTTRLAHVVNTRRAWPSQILAVTFTNRAAREMLERIAGLIGGAAQDLWLGTFHALAARLLRRHAERVGLKANFTILDTDDQIRLLKQLIQAERVDEKRWPARILLGAIERWKDRGLTPDRVSADEAGELAGGRLVALYAAYQDRLKVLNACDFGDLMLHNLTLFAADPDVLQQYQEKFKYILVDEYQDTNVAQYLWLRLLAQKQRNLCCVGDDDQSIYGWRGAEVGNILRFESDFPGAKIIRLEQNYRSTPHILGAASGLIANNESRLGKTLWTQLDEGEKVHVEGVWDGEEEARHVGEHIEALQRDGQNLKSMAILVRAGFQTREFEERLVTLGIRYKVIGGLRFYERAEIRDAIAYLRVVAQPDDDLAFERIVNTPKRGLGDATLQMLHGAARAAGASLFATAHRLVATDELKPAARRTLANLVQDFDRWRAVADRLGVGELAETVLDESGYTAMWQADKSPEAPGRLENLKELVTALEEFDSLTGFLEHVSLVMERAEDGSDDQITLMTLHSAKGLEFDTVFLPGWEEGLFPHQRAVDENGLKGLEEERRLAYVGLTRARRRAYVSYAANRRVHNLWQSSLPSRFLAELPPEHVERSAETGLGGGRGGGDRWSSSGFSEARFVPQQRWAPRPAPLIEGRAQLVESRPKAESHNVGSRIFHQKFGYGTVTVAEGDRLEIAFDKAGLKKVMASFVAKA
jgi:DNA helicase-2/ATP-dependent DNA helicase PcrA